jgi:hypothetical protein
MDLEIRERTLGYGPRGISMVPGATPFSVPQSRSWSKGFPPRESLLTGPDTMRPRPGPPQSDGQKNRSPLPPEEGQGGAGIATAVSWENLSSRCGDCPRNFGYDRNHRQFSDVSLSFLSRSEDSDGFSRAERSWRSNRILPREWARRGSRPLTCLTRGTDFGRPASRDATGPLSQATSLAPG